MIEWTRVRLTNWGKWCRGRAISGYPSASAFMFANLGARAADDTRDIPSDIAEVEEAIKRIAQPLRQVLVIYYVATGPLSEKANRLSISRRTLMRRVKTAEEKINLALASAPKG
jgi:DNA-directed RNA polymerase specialized sigma24 family protein